jgi:ATP-dependent DNA helicase RecG
VTVYRRIVKPEVIDFLAKADQTFKLGQRERIILGLLAQHDSLTARELSGALDLASVDLLHAWLKRVLEWGLVKSAGRTQATRYFIVPGLLTSLDFVRGTTLKRIETHRLLALIVEDVGRYPRSKIGEIHPRIGLEIARSRLRRGIEQLVKTGALLPDGARSSTRYCVPNLVKK